ncbi:hypothetical protein VaNZ11_003783, partial [Volvox africanus]
YEPRRSWKGHNVFNLSWNIIYSASSVGCMMLSTRQLSVTAYRDCCRSTPVPRRKNIIPTIRRSIYHILFEVMTSSGGEDHVDPESIPRMKFGSGDPHTQTSEDFQTTVAGCDELMAGEAPPNAMAELVNNVMSHKLNSHEARGTGGGGSGGSAGRTPDTQ